MHIIDWLIVLGALFILMALVGSLIKRLPLSPAMLYLVAGMLIGPDGAAMLDLDPILDATFLEIASELAVIISLFTTGLKLRVPLKDPLWRVPRRLAFVTMTATVAAIAAVGVGLLGLSLGAAVLLGAVLAPTDPVLASDLQVEDERDKEVLRFGLTGEAGLNDGTAFPFVMLGLGLLGLHELGEWGWRWLALDVVWATGAGLGIGTLFGTALARLVLYLRRHHSEAVGRDEFLALGLIGLSYGVALLVHAYGFLAVFAAGLALRRTERRSSPSDAPPDVIEAARAAEEPGDAPEAAPAHMAQAVLGFNIQIEHIAEVLLVLFVGAMLPGIAWPEHALLFVLLLLVVIRPLAVLLSLPGLGLTHTQEAYISLCGVRGVGSLFYLAFALSFGIARDEARTLADLTLITIATSIVVHGISVTPLMRMYKRVRARSADPDLHAHAPASASARSS